MITRAEAYDYQRLWVFVNPPATGKSIVAYNIYLVDPDGNQLGPYGDCYPPTPCIVPDPSDYPNDGLNVDTTYTITAVGVRTDNSLTIASPSVDATTAYADNFLMTNAQPTNNVVTCTCTPPIQDNFGGWTYSWTLYKAGIPYKTGSTTVPTYSFYNTKFNAQYSCGVVATRFTPVSAGNKGTLAGAVQNFTSNQISLWTPDAA